MVSLRRTFTLGTFSNDERKHHWPEVGKTKLDANTHAQSSTTRRPRLVQGPVVRRPISTNSGVNFTPGFFIPLFKNLLETIFTILVRTSRDQIASKKIWTALSSQAFRLTLGYLNLALNNPGQDAICRHLPSSLEPEYVTLKIQINWTHQIVRTVAAILPTCRQWCKLNVKGTYREPQTTKWNLIFFFLNLNKPSKAFEMSPVPGNCK